MSGKAGKSGWVRGAGQQVGQPSAYTPQHAHTFELILDSICDGDCPYSLFTVLPSFTSQHIFKHLLCYVTHYRWAEPVHIMGYGI